MLRLVRTVRADTAGGGDGDGNGPLYGDGGHNHHHGRDKQGGREDVFGIGAHHPNLTHKYPPRSQLSRPNRDLVSASVSNEKLADIDADADADADAEDAPSSDSSWRFILIADIHKMTWFSWSNYTVNKNMKSYSDNLEVIEHIYQNYGGELVVSPGDIVSYGSIKTISRLKELLKLEDEDISDEDAVYLAGLNAYSTTRKLFKEAGYDILLATIGDHELGGNEGFFVKPESKLPTIPKARQAFGDGFYRNGDSGEFEFEFDNQLWFADDDSTSTGVGDGDGAVKPRPLGTIYENTSYAYVHKNALFVTVDAFETVEDGSSDYINLEKGLGGEGAVTCTVDGDGEHLEWFENILRKGRDDPSIRHIIVQAHLPIIQTVQRYNCSGQFFDYGEQSIFWNLMNEYKVDLYLAGEVHANTVTKTRHAGSDLVQIVSRGVGYNNFLSIDVSENVLDVKIYNEIGNKPKFNAQYEESGHLTIDKTAAATQLSSSGMLKLLDLNSPLLIYDFEDIVPLGTRQVPGFDSKTSLMATESVIRGKICKESMYNNGQFGAQYDAQVCNILPVEGRDGGYGGYFYGDNTRMAVMGTGPFSAGETISFGLWFKTWQSKRKMVITHHSNYWGEGAVIKNGTKDSLTLVLDRGIPVIQTQPSRKVISTNPKNFADGVWHHIAVSMPRKSCYLSELKMYIDGHPVRTSAIGDRPIFHTTSGRLSFGGFGYSNSGFEDVYPDLEPYSGVLDDIVFFSRPLDMKADFPDLFVTPPSMSPVPSIAAPAPSSSVPTISCTDENKPIRFFWKLKKDGITPKLKPCSWLQKRSEKTMKRICKRKGWFEDSDPPAREICPFTCDTCVSK